MGDMLRMRKTECRRYNSPGCIGYNPRPQGVLGLHTVPLPQMLALFLNTHALISLNS